MKKETVKKIRNLKNRLMKNSMIIFEILEKMDILKMLFIKIDFKKNRKYQ